MIPELITWGGIAVVCGGLFLIYLHLRNYLLTVEKKLDSIMSKFLDLKYR